MTDCSASEFIQTNEAFLLTVVGAVSAALTLLLNTCIKSRCSEIKCFGLTCIRQPLSEVEVPQPINFNDYNAAQLGVAANV